METMWIQIGKAKREIPFSLYQRVQRHFMISAEQLLMGSKQDTTRRILALRDQGMTSWKHSLLSSPRWIPRSWTEPSRNERRR